MAIIISRKSKTKAFEREDKDYYKEIPYLKKHKFQKVCSKVRPPKCLKWTAVNNNQNAELKNIHN